jgi:hypothetical protein
MHDKMTNVARIACICFLMWALGEGMLPAMRFRSNCASSAKKYDEMFLVGFVLDSVKPSLTAGTSNVTIHAFGTPFVSSHTYFVDW